MYLHIHGILDIKIKYMINIYDHLSSKIYLLHLNENINCGNNLILISLYT